MANSMWSFDRETIARRRTYESLFNPLVNFGGDRSCQFQTQNGKFQADTNGLGFERTPIGHSQIMFCPITHISRKYKEYIRITLKSNSNNIIIE
jgi:hypothetical protein